MPEYHSCNNCKQPLEYWGKYDCWSHALPSSTTGVECNKPEDSGIIWTHSKGGE